MVNTTSNRSALCWQVLLWHSVECVGTWKCIAKITGLSLHDLSLQVPGFW